MGNKYYTKPEPIFKYHTEPINIDSFKGLTNEDKQALLDPIVSETEQGILRSIAIDRIEQLDLIDYNTDDIDTIKLIKENNRLKVENANLKNEIHYLEDYNEFLEDKLKGDSNE